MHLVSSNELEGVIVVKQSLMSVFLEQLSVQILVVVAHNQMRTLKTEVEKGSM